MKLGSYCVGCPFQIRAERIEPAPQIWSGQEGVSGKQCGSEHSELVVLLVLSSFQEKAF